MQIIVAIHRLLITGTYYSYIAAIGLFAIHTISKGTQFPYLELISHLLLISVLGGIFKIVDIGTLVSSDQPDDNLFSGHHCPRAIDLPTPSIVFLSVIGCCITSFILGYSCGHRVSPSQSSKHSDSQISTSKIVMADNSQRKFALKSKRLNMKSPPPISSSQASLHEYESVCINETESVVPSETVSHDISESVMTGGGPNFLEIQIGKSGVSYESLIADARASLSAILTMRSTLKGEYESCNWALVRSSSSCHIWVSRSDKMLREGILIRGVASLKADPRQVLDYIIDKDLTLGIEGVVYRADDSSVLMSDGVNRVLSRTVRCKSGSIIGYNREFSLITSISQEKDNKFVIASRSFPVEVKAQQSQSKKEKVSLIHGVLYASGYHIQPQFQSGDRGGHGCEISFATHLDFRGSKVSRTNSIKADVLIGSLYKSMETIKFKLEKSSEFTAHSKITGHTTSSEITNLPSTSDSIAPVTQLSIKELNIDDMEMKFELPSSSGLPPLSPHGDSDGAIDLSEDQKQQLFDVAQEALSRMRSLHRSVVSPNHGGVGGRSDDDDSDVFGIDSQTTGDRRNQWETFYNHDGITVKEFNDRQSPIGILNATVSTQASPHVVRKLLLEHPDAVDGLLSGRSVLCSLNKSTFVQWLAYSSIWPVGARDFLMVTSEESFDKSTGEGFAIVSTSIDHICELEDNEDGKSFNAVTSEGSESIQYMRSNLRLAGYIGTPNKSGGTDLFLFVDVDVYSYVPAWLLQILAQYGLSEIMSRIRGATTGQQLKSSSTQYELNKILSQIQSREAKMRQFMNIEGANSSSSTNSGNEDSDSPAQSAVKASFLGSIFGEGGWTATVPKTATIAATITTASVSTDTDTHAAMKVATERLHVEKESIPSTLTTSSSSAPTGFTTLTTSSDEATIDISTSTSSVAVETAEVTIARHIEVEPKALEAKPTPEAVVLSLEKVSPWRSSLPFLQEPYNLEGRQLALEAVKKFRVYIGIDPASPEEVLGLDWQLKASKKEIHVWTSPVLGSAWQAIKGTTIIKADKLDILRLFLDDGRIGEYDDMFDAVKFITAVDDRTAIKRIMFKAIWPTAPRDFLACTTWRELDDGSILITTRSAPDSLFPQQKGFVRGFLHISGYWIQPHDSLKNDFSVPPGHCRVTLTAHSELGGTLPVSIINMLATAAPMKLLAAVDEVVKRK